MVTVTREVALHPFACAAGGFMCMVWRNMVLYSAKPHLIAFFFLSLHTKVDRMIEDAETGKRILCGMKGVAFIDFITYKRVLCESASPKTRKMAKVASTRGAPISPKIILEAGGASEIFQDAYF